MKILDNLIIVLLFKKIIQITFKNYFTLFNGHRI